MDSHQKAFREFKHRVSDFEGVEEVYLFGSVAREVHGVNSDVDIFVKGQEELRHEIEEIAFEISLEEDVSITVIVNESMESRLGQKVLSEGVTRVEG